MPSTPRPKHWRCWPRPARRSIICRLWARLAKQFHPGQSATLRLGPKNVLARFGMIHPGVLSAFDIEVPVVVAELFLDAIPGKKGAATFARAQYAPPALQAVTRDFAFVVAYERPRR